jgi:glycosyltransferase involved in cell wall biosynthesis
MYMELVLIVFGVGFFIELLLFAPFIWKNSWLQSTFYISAAACMAFASTWLLLTVVNTASILIAFITLYRVINMLRVVEARMNPHYLRNAVARTSTSLALLQALVGVTWFVGAQYSIATNVWLGVAVAFQVLTGIVLFASTLRRLKHTRIPATEKILTTNELPNVTVAIPARNETEDLYDCLVTLLKNNYPKLEILVLDDCSQLRRTPEIIREFAHAGVRFVKGDTPKENWLAKNQAYDKLLHESSGEIVLFCGVDVRFEPDAIKQLVTALLNRKKRMVSVLPIRRRTSGLRYAAIQAARYFWELAPPRRLFNRPPVLSTCWAAYRSDLLKLGGFGAVSRSIIPEAYFAKQMLSKDGYSFLRADNTLQLSSVKNDQAQRNTAIRTRYPQLHRRPETVLSVLLVGLLCFIVPYAIIIWGLLGNVPWYFAIGSLVSILLCNTAYTLIATATRVNGWYIAPFCFLPTVCADIVMTHYSMYKYEFSEVLWKGRNICVPVMHVIPHLPKL